MSSYRNQIGNGDHKICGTLKTTSDPLQNYRLNNNNCDPLSTSWGLKDQWRTTHLPIFYSIFKQRHSFSSLFSPSSVSSSSISRGVLDFDLCPATQLGFLFLSNFIPDVLAFRFSIWLRLCIRGMWHSRSAFPFLGLFSEFFCYFGVWDFFYNSI